MTDTPHDAPRAGEAATLDWEDPSDLPMEEVRDVFITLGKALRAYQLYDPNNPVYKRFVSGLRDAFLRIWESRDELEILVDEDRFTWLGEEVYRNENRTESLSFMFYRDGIRDLTLKKGLEEEELERLLDALHRTRHARGEGDDLVTILWEMDFKHLRYTALDILSEGLEMPGGGTPAPLNDPSAIVQEEVGNGAAPPAAEEGEDGGEASGAPAALDTVRTDDFNPALYSLDKEEMEHVRGELRKERERDLRTDVLNALFDRLEEPERPDRQEEIVQVLRTLLPNLLSRGALASAGKLVQELDEIRGRGVLGEGAGELADRLFEDLSSEELVEELVRALEDETIPPDAEPLGVLLANLRASALAPLLRASEASEIEAVRDVLRKAIETIVRKDPEPVLRLVKSDDPSVAAGAVRLVGRLQITNALGGLVELLKSGPPAVRLAVVETAEIFPSSVLAEGLTRVLDDEDRDLRIGAARVLGRSRYQPAADRFRSILGGKGLRDADVTEKVAFFEAYGMLTGDEGISYLDKVLNGKKLLGRREPPEMRAGAALALGKIGTPEARQSLEKAKQDGEPVVRSAVGRALREAEGRGDGEEAEDG